MLIYHKFTFLPISILFSLLKCRCMNPLCNGSECNNFWATLSAVLVISGILAACRRPPPLYGHALRQPAPNSLQRQRAAERAINWPNQMPLPSERAIWVLPTPLLNGKRGREWMAALTAAQLSWRFCVVGGIKSRCVLLVSKANQLIERKCIAKKRVEIGFRIYVEI